MRSENISKHQSFDDFGAIWYVQNKIFNSDISKMFYVVQLDSDIFKEKIVVPSIWLDKCNTLCLLPPVTDFAEVETLAKAQSTPKHGWQLHSVSFIQSFDTYSQAKQNITKGKPLMIDLEEEEEKHPHKEVRGKRKRKFPRFLEQYSIESDDDIEEDCSSTQDDCSMEDNIVPDPLIVKIETMEDSNVLVSHQQPQLNTTHNKSSSLDHTSLQHDSQLQVGGSSSSTVRFSLGTTPSLCPESLAGEKCSNCNELEKRITTMEQEIVSFKRILMDINQTKINIPTSINKRKQQNSQKVKGFQRLKTTEDLTACNKKLKDNGVFSKTKKFALVEFSDNSVATVPMCWMKEDCCYWPNVKDTSRLAKAMQDPKEGWRLYKVHIKSVYATYDEAKKNEKQFSSDFESTDSDGLGKRKRTIDHDSSDDDDEIIKGCSSLLNFPPLPTVRQSPEEANLSQDCSFTNSTDVVNSAPKNYEVLAEEPHISSDNFETTNDAGMQAQILKAVLHNKFVLKEQSKMISTIVDTLNCMYESLPSGSNVQNNEMCLPVNLPLANFDDLALLEEALKAENLQEYLCEKIYQVGGSNLKNTVRRMLRMLMTDEVATSFSWAGIREKEPFAYLKITSILISAVRRNSSYNHCTYNDIEIAIKDWLRHAKARCKK